MFTRGISAPQRRMEAMVSCAGGVTRVIPRLTPPKPALQAPRSLMGSGTHRSCNRFQASSGSSLAGSAAAFSPPCMRQRACRRGLPGGASRRQQCVSLAPCRRSRVGHSIRRCRHLIGGPLGWKLPRQPPVVNTQCSTRAKYSPQQSPPPLRASISAFRTRSTQQIHRKCSHLNSGSEEMQPRRRREYSAELSSSPETGRPTFVEGNAVVTFASESTAANIKLINVSPYLALRIEPSRRF